MIKKTYFRSVAAVLALSVLGSSMTLAQSTPDDFVQRFDQEITVKDPLSHPQIERYRQAMLAALTQAHAPVHQEFVVVVDRSPGAQHLLLFLGTGPDAKFIGATPVSTGDVGHLNHYITPAGVFEHSATEDFRALGVENDSGVRGYGRTGMRVWDFGWQTAVKGWLPEDHAQSGQIRMQLHATDPSLLESHLGYRHSEGCIRVAASMNEFLDHYGILDQSYDVAFATKGRKPWVWAKNHVQTPYSGRYLVVLDTPKAPATTAAR